ncbi:MAG: hypothetical protein ACKVIR_02320 [Candidatus Poseidoniales archaeon]
MKFSRIITTFILILAVGIFLTMQSQFDENGRWGLVGTIILLAMLWVVQGGNSKPVEKPNRTVKQAVVKSEVEVEIPEPVVKDELAGASLRERKLAKVQSSQEPDQEEEEDDGLEEVEVTVEEVHVADQFVVEVSAQSIEDADISSSIRVKSDRNAQIRARIEERRRGQMADIRASTAKMWEDHSAGEDLVTLITSENHQHTVLEEPEIAKAGHVYGATLVRLNESSILKLRVPLDDGFVAVDEKEKSIGMPIPLPEGVPSPSDLGLPLPLPPPPGASGALAALKGEMSED